MPGSTAQFFPLGTDDTATFSFNSDKQLQITYDYISGIATRYDIRV